MLQFKAGNINAATREELLGPILPASALYYKTKLAVHNFIILDIAWHYATDYLWHEREAGLSDAEFVSCTVHYQEAHLSYKEYILWSHGCGGQNKKQLTLKFLERGHTEIECSSLHRVLKSRLKHKDICSSWVYCGDHSGLRPYHVRYVNHTFFMEFSQVNFSKSSCLD